MNVHPDLLDFQLRRLHKYLARNAVFLYRSPRRLSAHALSCDLSSSFDVRCLSSHVLSLGDPAGAVFLTPSGEDPHPFDRLASCHR